MSHVSVVIPVKDDAPMLENCLESLRRQSRAPDEIIVVDNGSTDDSVWVARLSGATVITESRPGITAAASCGYDAAHGDVIARCDADSVLPTDWLARIEHVLAEHTEAAAVTGSARFYDLGRAADLLARLFYLSGYFVSVRAAIANTPLFGSNFAMRREAWMLVSGSVPRDEPELHDDLDLSYRIPPEQTILFDRQLVVGISGRPFKDLAAIRRRMTRAGVTLRQHWPEQLPHRRWARKLRAQAHTVGRPPAGEGTMPPSSAGRS